MRSNKGITLTSLIIYMIVFSIVIGTVSMITGNLISNTDNVQISVDLSEQYTRLTTYLTDDINSINFESINVEDDKINITFVNGLSHQYVYNNDKIYYISQKGNSIDKIITLCNKITGHTFLYQDGKLKISITIDEITYNNNYSI